MYTRYTVCTYTTYNVYRRYTVCTIRIPGRENTNKWPESAPFAAVCGRFHNSDRQVDLNSGKFAALTPPATLSEATFGCPDPL